MWLSLLAVPLLIAANAFFVICEYVVVATRPGQVDHLRGRGFVRVAAALERLKDAPANAIGAIQVCITMSNLLLGWVGEPAMSWLLATLFAPIVALAPHLLAPASTVLSFITVTFLTVVFSELLPKAVTLRFSGTLAIVTVVPVLMLQRVLWPLVWLMNKAADLVTQPLNLGRVEDLEDLPVTADELMSITREAAKDGVVTAQEREIIINALSMGKRRARDVMVHRLKVGFLDLHKTMEQNREVVESHLHTRLPVCDGDMDNVIGIITAKEFETAYHEGGESSVLQLLAKPAVFVPDTLTVGQLLQSLHQNRTEMLVVVDERGCTRGIVTLRDVIDEILGE